MNYLQSLNQWFPKLEKLPKKWVNIFSKGNWIFSTESALIRGTYQLKKYVFGVYRNILNYNLHSLFL